MRPKPVAAHGCFRGFSLGGFETYQQASGYPQGLSHAAASGFPAAAENGLSLSWMNARMISSASSVWRMPFSASRRALSSGSWANSTCSVEVWRSAIGANCLLVLLLVVQFSISINDQFPRDTLVAQPLGLASSNVPGPLDQLVKFFCHSVLPILTRRECATSGSSLKAAM